MLPGMDSATGKAAYVVLGSLVFLFSTCRLVRLVQGGKDTIEFQVYCTKCYAKEQRDLPVDGGRLPVRCGKCGEKAAYPWLECPTCHKDIGYDPKKPPAACPHCGADLTRLFKRAASGS